MTSSTGFLPRRLAAGVFVVSSLIAPTSPWGASSASAHRQEPRLDQPSFDDADVPAHIAIVDGTATVERDGRLDSAIENDVVLAGDRFRTERGRLEVMFADGSVLDVDQDSEIDLLSDSLMRLRTGRVRLSIPSGAQAPPDYRVDATPGSVRLRTAGNYRISLTTLRTAGAELDVAALHGLAELQNAGGRTLVRAGTHARIVAESQPSVPYAFNSAISDGFDRWSEDQRAARLGLSSSYLPQNLRYYGGELDRSGTWGYEPAYGNVWYPSVDPGWRPYSAGQWSFAAHIGWFWVGAGRWSWPTHHYGRWGVGAARWFWIPDRRWGPAWVSWASAPGYVSWCPLGYYGRPVIGIVDLSYRPGWTVIPVHSFAPRVQVSRYVVDGRSLPASVRGSLVVRNAAPISYDSSRGPLPLRGPAPYTQRVDAAASRRIEPSGIASSREVSPLASSSVVRREQIDASRPSSNATVSNDRPRTQTGAARLSLSSEGSTSDRPRAVSRSIEPARTSETRSSALSPAPDPASFQRSPIPRPASSYGARSLTPDSGAFDRLRTAPASRASNSVDTPSPSVFSRSNVEQAPASPAARQPYGRAERRPTSAVSPSSESPGPGSSAREPERARPGGSDPGTAPVPAARDAGSSSSGSRSRPSSSDQGRAVPRGRGGR